MADVAKKTALSANQTFQPLRHLIHRLREPTDFIRLIQLHAIGKFAFGNLFGERRDLGQRTGDAADQGQPKQSGEADDQQQDGDPRPRFGKKTFAEHRVTAQQQHGVKALAVRRGPQVHDVP